MGYTAARSSLKSLFLWALVYVLNGINNNLDTPHTPPHPLAHKQCCGQKPDLQLVWMSCTFTAKIVFPVPVAASRFTLLRIWPQISKNLRTFLISFMAFSSPLFLCSWEHRVTQVNVEITAILQQRIQSHFSIFADKVRTAHPNWPPGPALTIAKFEYRIRLV